MGDGVGVAGRNDIFTDFVCDERSGGTLGKTRPRLGRSGDRRGKVFDLHAVRVQRKRRGCGAEAVLVVGVVPDLLRRDIDRLGDVRVRDGPVVVSIIYAGGGVAFRRVPLLDPIGDPDIRSGPLSQSRPGVGPIVRCGDGLNDRTPGVVEREIHGIRANAILVVRVVPDLGDLDVYGVMLVSVRDRPRVAGSDYRRGIMFRNRILAHVVIDLASG